MPRPSQLLMSAVKFSVLDDVSNNSDHVGFLCEVNFGNEHVVNNLHGDRYYNIKLHQVYVWSDFAKTSCYYLTGVCCNKNVKHVIVKCCNNVPCSDSGHNLAINHMNDYLVQLFVRASHNA